jgi:hypothetical protein
VLLYPLDSGVTLHIGHELTIRYLEPPAAIVFRIAEACVKPLLAGMGSDMPFADHGGGVSASLQCFSRRGLAEWQFARIGW